MPVNRNKKQWLDYFNFLVYMASFDRPGRAGENSFQEGVISLLEWHNDNYANNWSCKYSDIGLKMDDEIINISSESIEFSQDELGMGLSGFI